MFSALFEKLKKAIKNKPNKVHPKEPNPEEEKT
jgi:hypothetical protein